MDLSSGTSNNLSDADDEKWLEWLMDEYGEALTNLSYSYVKDWGKAQEIVQDVFVTVYKRRHTYNEIKSFKAWIYRITINRCKDVLKSSWLKRVVIGDSLFNYFHSKDSSPEQSAVRKSEEEEILGYVFKLPLKYRETLLLYYYEKLTIPEISQLLAINENTVKTRMRRGKERLKKGLEGSDFDGR